MNKLILCKRINFALPAALLGLLFSLVPIARQAAMRTFAAAPSQQQTDANISAEGMIVPPLFTDLSFQTNGIVTDILVSEGDLVAAGEPLIYLDNQDSVINLQRAQAQLTSAAAGLIAAQNKLGLAEADIQTAQAQLAIAQANLALIQSGPLPEEVAAAEENLAIAEAMIAQAAGNRDASLEIVTEAQIQAAEANLASATADLNAIEDQYQTILDTCYDTPDGEVCPLYGPVEESTRRQLEVAQAQQLAAQAVLHSLQSGATPAQVQAANGAVAVAIANRDVAQAELESLLAGASAGEITIAVINVEQAEVAVETAAVQATQAEAAVSAAEASVVAAEAGVVAAEAALDRMFLYATFDGTVASVDVNIGEFVTASVPVLTLADFSHWIVETTDLTELDVAQIEKDMPVAVQIDSIPGETIVGTVTKIALLSTQSQGDIIYKVNVQLEETPTLPLRWGMTVFVDIEANNE